MSTSKPALDRPAGTITQALVRVQEDGARLTSTASVLPDDRSIVTTPVTVEPARTGSGRSRETTAAVVVPRNEQLTPPPADAGPADVRPTVPTVSSRTGRASTGRFISLVLLEVTGPLSPIAGTSRHRTLALVPRGDGFGQEPRSAGPRAAPSVRPAEGTPRVPPWRRATQQPME